MQRSLIVSLVVVALIALCSACAMSPSTPASARSQVAAGEPCNSDADCAVKDIGSCCGYYPQCVNVAHQSDPAAVKAACASEGRSSICGFPDIAGCRCVDKRCTASETAADSQ